MATGGYILGSTTALAANGVFTSPNFETVNTPGGDLFTYFRVIIGSDQGGTLEIQQSMDNGTTWWTTISQATDAALGTVVESIVTAPLVRYVFTNGTTAQTTFQIASNLINR